MRLSLSTLATPSTMWMASNLHATVRVAQAMQAKVQVLGPPRRGGSSGTGLDALVLVAGLAVLRLPWHWTTAFFSTALASPPMILAMAAAAWGRRVHTCRRERRPQQRPFHSRHSQRSHSAAVCTGQAGEKLLPIRGFLSRHELCGQQNNGTDRAHIGTEDHNGEYS